MSKAQISMWEEKIVDSFAGGGGASTGIELATGRVVDIAINHDPDAILMHKTNHPHTVHYQASVWDVDPLEVTGGSPVGLLWASPDCKHFSKAKGGKPVNKRIRGTGLDRSALGGNGPPPRDHPGKCRGVPDMGASAPRTPGKGKDRANIPAVYWPTGGTGLCRRVAGTGGGGLWSANHPQTVFLIARCDGRPIVWPEPTYAPADSREVLEGRKKPWRSAAEIIDWSLPCPSIFDTREEIREKYGLSAQRPLRPNTMRRVARGVDKFVIKSAAPFIVPMGYGERNGQAPRVHNIADPAPTAVGKGKHGVCGPAMVPWTVTNTTNSTGHPANEPIDTARTGGGGGQMFLGASLIQYHTEQSEHVRGQEITGPIMTIDAANRYGLTAASLVKYYGNDRHGQNIQDPLHTVISKDHEGLTTAHLVKMKGTNLGGPATEPVQTITAGGGHHGVVTTRITRAEPGADLKHWPEIRELLNTYCGYDLGPEDVILLQIGGVWYFMADIGLRMLTPRELYRANGFPDDYKIERDYTGQTYGKSKQVARCGNAVPPPFAAALVRANLPEWCAGVEISTMEELERAVAV